MREGQVTLFGLSLVETERLDRIERQLKKVNLKLDVLLQYTVPPDQLAKLGQEVGALDSKAAALQQALEENR